MHLTEQIDAIRVAVSGKLDPARRSALGQFMTPSPTARFMASLFTQGDGTVARLLDAGAGVGSLTTAFLERRFSGWGTFNALDLVTYEVDPLLQGHLRENLSRYQVLGRARGMDVTVAVHARDFIETAARQLLSGDFTPCTHAILNPPYKKINSDSAHRHWLRTVGIETVNLYTAFLALAVDLLAPGGEMVAIVPRSFCNGTYYRPFRERFLHKVSIRQIHLYEARNKAFRDGDVLQENIILHLVKGRPQGPVIVSTSTDDSLHDYRAHTYPFAQIVKPGDAESFIHIPAGPAGCPIEASGAITHSLADLGISASTGPVVDFRAREYLRTHPGEDTVPLLYPAHFGPVALEWPKAGGKKPNAIVQHPGTQKSLYPNGYYTVVRRFSSKEEKKRIVANVVDPAVFPAGYLGFENHLNVFHEKKAGLSRELAYGLFVFLSSTLADDYFRRFNGHTQVNVGDLKQMKYPSRQALTELGTWALTQQNLSQEIIDERVAALA